MPAVSETTTLSNILVHILFYGGWGWGWGGGGGGGGGGISGSQIFCPDCHSTICILYYIDGHYSNYLVFIMFIA